MGEERLVKRVAMEALSQNYYFATWDMHEVGKWLPPIQSLYLLWISGWTMFGCVGNIEVTGGEERLCSFNQDRNQCAFSVNAPIQIGSGSILLTKLFEIILYIIDYHLSSISHEASPSSLWHSSIPSQPRTEVCLNTCSHWAFNPDLLLHVFMNTGECCFLWAACVSLLPQFQLIIIPTDSNQKRMLSILFEVSVTT